MKKLLLIFAAAALLVACNKKNEPTTPTEPEQKDTAVVITNNQIVDFINEIMPFQGIQLSQLETSLNGEGWTKFDRSEIYGKVGTNLRGEVSYKANASGVVYNITLSVMPYKTGSTYEPSMTVDYAKDVIKKIGSNCEMGVDRINCRYLCAYTGIGQRYTVSPSDFAATFTEGNLNAVTVYYLDTKIENWTKPTEGQTAAPYTGVMIGYRTAAAVEGSTKTEFNVAVDFTDETLAD